MVYNQTEFNKEYNNKEVKEIKIDCEDFEGQLVIEDYPNLETLSLKDSDVIEKITLKNLPQLQKCTIWNCDLEDLVIENCPNIEKLNVRKNSLTSLEFLVNLRKLTELDIAYNPELAEILKPYGGDWKKLKAVRFNKGSSYEIKSSSKKKSELETQIEILPKSEN